MTPAPPASAAVVRRYQRLLRAYPAGPRRAELLDTLLLAAADEGRTGPSARQTVNLLLTGARARLGRPGSVSIVVLAVLVSLVAGLYTASAASVIAWRVAAPPLPNAAQLAQIGEVVTPGRPAVAETAPGLFHSTDEGVRFDTASYWTPDYAATRDLPGYAAGLRNRLESNGWEIREHEIVAAGVTSSGITFGARMTLSAARGDWLLSIETDGGSGEATPAPADAVGVQVERLSPWPVRVATLAGLVPGLLLGWLFTGWVSRRTERHHLASTITVLLTGLSLTFLSIQLGVAATKLAAEVWNGSTDAEPFWHFLVYDYEAGFITVFATVLAVAVLPVAILAPLRGTRAPH
ncbi:hypothetical protein ACIA8K_34425 [Catenuloplanes sp. NPDC051500]|uniref:hypothetical protein n=1 Tax=Catenuloplanes sp. NPDC051500 TaxID=3363959 RepID=UPI0037922BAB